MAAGRVVQHDGVLSHAESLMRNARSVLDRNRSPVAHAMGLELFTLSTLSRDPDVK